MFKPHIDYNMVTTVPSFKGGEFEAAKMGEKSHDLYKKLGNVGQSRYAPYIKVHEEFILILLFPQTINYLVGSKFKFLKSKDSLTADT